MDKYRNFLVYFKNNDYTFMDFKEFHYANKEELPEKLLVLRHDIHQRDIPNGYKMMEIEREVLGKVNSTFFVQYNFKPVFKKRYMIEQSKEYQENYKKNILYCINNNIDVQPHISPIGIYIRKYNPFWSKLNPLEIETKINNNYKLINGKYGNNIDCINIDFLDINTINTCIIDHCKGYNKDWKEITGNNPLGYSAHGESGVSFCKTNININANTIIDQDTIVESKIFEYSANSSLIYKYLDYLSDNYLPSWMNNPNEIDITKRYQALIHPAQWK